MWKQACAQATAAMRAGGVLPSDARFSIWDGQSSRAMLGRIRRQLAGLARLRHRGDLAELFEPVPKQREGSVGPSGGSVRIKTQGHVIQEERTYPRKADPKRSKG